MALGGILGFGKGVLVGLGEGGKALAGGAWDLAKGGYHLATDENARDQAWRATKEAARSAKDAVVYAKDYYSTTPRDQILADTKQTWSAARDKANQLYTEFDKARQDAAARGESGEFYGKIAGRGGFEAAAIFIPVSKVANLVRGARAAKVAEAAGAGGRIVSEASAAAKAQATVSRAKNAADLAVHVGGCEKTANEARLLLQKAAAAEVKTTPRLKAIAARNGMKMEGLDFRLKTADSLTRKLADTPPEKIGDALRYTMVSSDANLAKDAAHTLNALESEGYKVLKVKNTFRSGAPYKGVNTQVMSPDGQIFELQFHTPQSFHTKQNLTHGLYEEQRVLPPSNPRWSEINKNLIDISSNIPDPPHLQEHLARFAK